MLLLFLPPFRHARHHHREPPALSGKTELICVRSIAGGGGIVFHLIDLNVLLQRLLPYLRSAPAALWLLLQGGGRANVDRPARAGVAPDAVQQVLGLESGVATGGAEKVAVARVENAFCFLKEKNAQHVLPVPPSFVMPFVSTYLFPIWRDSNLLQFSPPLFLFFFHLLSRHNTCYTGT